MSAGDRGHKAPPSARWAAIEQLFTRALELPPGEREDLLAAACPDDTELRREVGNLLAAHDGVIAQGGTGQRFLEQLDAEHAAALIEPPVLRTLRDALVDRYAVERPLASGGMAEVFAARDLRHDRMVAIKVVRQDGFTARLDDRFAREVRIAARLQHPHIVPLYDSGVAAGHRYYVMPLIDGPTLRQRLRETTRLPVEEVLRIAEEVAGALDYAHASGIVHRDIKPENVLLSGGHALVADFGIARPAPKTDGLSTTMTGVGLALGTPAYMSPEQAAGERAVDGRSDQYALGCLVYELFTGRPPFVADSAQAVIGKHFREPVPPLALGPPSPSRAIHDVISRALAKDPAQRFATTVEFASALRAATARPRESGPPLARFGISRRITRALIATIIVLVLVATGYNVVSRDRVAGSEFRTRGPTKSIAVLPSVAVLPLKNYSGDQAQDYFADGMTDELTNTLAKISALRVIAHQSVLQFKHSRQSVPEIARLLNVKHVVDGSVLQDGNRVRITATLIDAARNTPIWGERFERERRDVMALQREVALAIAQAIEIALTPQDLARLEDTAAVNPDAFDLYVRGTQARYKGVERQDIAEALRYFARAVAKDSAYAPAYAGLASAYVFSGDEARARRFVETALALDPRLAEAHVALGLIQQTYQWDWRGSEQSFRQAIRLNPGFAEAHHELSMLLMRRRRFDEALQEAQRTLYVAPMSSRFELGLAQIYLMSGRYDEALRASDKVLALESTRRDAYWLKALAFEQQQRYGNAEEMWSKFLALGGDADEVRGGLGRIYAVSGRRSAALKILDTLKNRWVERKGQVTSYGTAMAIAGIHASLGDRKQAVDWAERAAAPGAFMLYLAIDPQLLPLHGEPRFQALLRKMGLALSNE